LFLSIPSFLIIRIPSFDFLWVDFVIFFLLFLLLYAVIFFQSSFNCLLSFLYLKTV
jgi:hypothetical protein